MKRWFLAPIMAAMFSGASAADQAWPFDQPRNTAVITLKQIVQHKVPILFVTHDPDDHGWQFLNPSVDTAPVNASVVGLEQIVRMDPSLLEIADLPVGWSASRGAVGGRWVRRKLPASAEK